MVIQMKNKCGCNCNQCGGAIYGIGMIGAAVYFIMNTTGFWGVVLAILKAIVWPAFMVYGLLKFLGM